MQAPPLPSGRGQEIESDFRQCQQWFYGRDIKCWGCPFPFYFIQPQFQKSLDTVENNNNKKYQFSNYFPHCNQIVTLQGQYTEWGVWPASFSLFKLCLHWIRCQHTLKRLEQGHENEWMNEWVEDWNVDRKLIYCIPNNPSFVWSWLYVFCLFKYESVCDTIFTAEFPLSIINSLKLPLCQVLRPDM